MRVDISANELHGKHLQLLSQIDFVWCEYVNRVSMNKRVNRASNFNLLDTSRREYSDCIYIDIYRTHQEYPDHLCIHCYHLECNSLEAIMSNHCRTQLRRAQEVYIHVPLALALVS